MQKIGQQQFLVLLFVIDPQFDQGADAGPGRVVRPVDKVNHGLVHVPAVLRDFRDAGPGQHAAAGAGMPVTFGLVVGVEEIAELRVEGPVAGLELLQDEGLEEPGRMRQMPFGGTGVFHGLHHLVFRRQVGHQCLRQGARRDQVLPKRRTLRRIVAPKRLGCVFHGWARSFRVARAGP